MSLDSGRHRRISELFLAARELARPEQSRLLERECMTDPAMRSEIESLLASDSQTALFLELGGRQALPLAPSADDIPIAAALIDRSLAQFVMHQARRLMEARANAGGSEARRRVELLRLRFEEGRPICDIAHRWSEDPARVQQEFARASQEFDQALRDSIAFHGPASAAEIEAECRRLLAAVARGLQARNHESA